MQTETVIVIGGGASGIMAALTAAEEPSRRVILLERQQRIGRKLLSTGNGRCNLTNTGASPADYHGEDVSFAASVLNKFSPADTLDFFSGLGLVTVEEYGGRVYPLSDSANSVLDVLRFALERARVEVRCSCCVEEIRRCNGGFQILAGEDSFFAHRLILACGGCAGSKLGGVMDGYVLAKALGHKRTALYPSLVQLTTEPEYPRALKGVRADALVRLMSGGACIAQSEGELQFTDKGVSGPAAFDVSRAASSHSGALRLVMDFFRAYTEDEVYSMLSRRRSGFPALPCSELFTGMLHNRLGRMLVKYAGLTADTPLSALTDVQLRSALAGCKAFTLPVKGTEGFDHAQVTAGGLSTRDFNAETLESRLVPHLYVCGELLDVDGNCGGYNLQWAWASGRLAGRLGG